MPNAAGAKGVGALRDRHDERHRSGDVLPRELDLGDQRRQRGGVADTEADQHDARQQERHARASGQEQRAAAEDLHE